MLDDEGGGGGGVDEDDGPDDVLEEELEIDEDELDDGGGGGGVLLLPPPLFAGGVEEGDGAFPLVAGGGSFGVGIGVKDEGGDADNEESTEDDGIGRNESEGILERKREKEKR